MKKFISLFLLSFSFVFAGEKVDILFYLQDAGETLALIPVARELQKRGVAVKILAAGVAPSLLSGEIPTLSFPGLNVDKRWTREQTASSLSMTTLIEEVEPRLVVTGVAYELQGQVLDAFHDKLIPAVAYWDNFNGSGENPYFKTARAVADHADLVLVPIQNLASQFSKSAVVGQPTLEEWQTEIGAMLPHILRQRLGICPCKKVALFIGGYGPDYEKSLSLFAESMERNQDPLAMILIQPHPKNSDGAVEEAILENLALPYRILQGEVTTKEAVALADWVACHQSTVAFQALAAGKPVLHFIPEGQSFSSLALEKGLAQKVIFPEDFNTAYERAVERAERGDFFEEIGAPRRSASLCAEVLLQLLQN